jgi:hypothetical protein
MYYTFSNNIAAGLDWKPATQVLAINGHHVGESS